MVAIDLGSNTIRFIEFDGLVWGKSFEKIVRTAEGLHETHLIANKALDRIIEAIDDAKNIFDFTQPIRAYTTAAMRLAHNSDEAIGLIARSTGIVFEIIDAEKEGLLTLEAVRNRLNVLGSVPSSFVLADIGGGSTELSRYTNTEIETVSLDFGIVTLSEAAENTLDEKIQSFKHAVRGSIKNQTEPLVLTAGTPTTIAAYVNGMDYTTYDPQKINGYRLRLSDCYRVYDELLRMDEAARTRYVGIGRENLIIAGVLMVTAIYEAMECEEAIIIDDGLREGIALEYYKLH
ncbi:MAG: phosphatase [Sulfuricurvum sp.]|uniref:Ppx/GppA phosphatase family protein n=1 Tax=Sulfuricurvum sp. TaxID=2025608 RepID=UPI00271A5A5A|nr:phosphatase [Sulfuricurvum sp.]MDO9056876.1 phosphatase [Sulfuricurvum sp.]